MSNKLNGLASMETVDDPAQIQGHRVQLMRFKKNVDWLERNAAGVYRDYRGMCICVAGQELFVADTAEAAIALAQEAHPDDDGRFVHYIPKQKLPRIYAS